MSVCNVDHTDNRNNGLITKIWGGPGWTFVHAITFGYPIDPTTEQKKHYKDYFILLGYVLPCRFCRESYQKFISEGKTALTEAVLENRETLTRWLYEVHEEVNHKLEIDYGVTYENLVNRFEGFRARCNMADPLIKGCVTPLDYKAFSYKKLNQIDCPIVPFELANPFIKLAKIRNIDKKYFAYEQLIDYFKGNFTELKKQESWDDRNKFCQKQIKFIRESGISSIEENGKWKGTPCIEELKLFLFLCSNLNRTEITNCLIVLSKNSYYLSKINSIY